MKRPVIILAAAAALMVLLVASLATAQSDICEGNFDCDKDVDASDAAAFKNDFGRSAMMNPCSNLLPCDGDFNCDKDVDSSDASAFEQDFGRSSMLNPCTSCVPAAWCDYPVTSSTTSTCTIEIVYGRPGRRGIPLTCNDIVDFTLCSDCDLFDPLCLVWTISPPASWLSIEQTDYCQWRLVIGDYCCEDPDSLVAYEVTVTDTCNNTSDTVVISFL
jgi:hypothetical protein